MAEDAEGTNRLEDKHACECCPMAAQKTEEVREGGRDSEQEGEMERGREREQAKQARERETERELGSHQQGRWTGE